MGCSVLYLIPKCIFSLCLMSSFGITPSKSHSLQARTRWKCFSFTCLLKLGLRVRILREFWEHWFNFSSLRTRIQISSKLKRMKKIKNFNLALYFTNNVVFSYFYLILIFLNSDEDQNPFFFYICIGSGSVKLNIQPWPNLKEINGQVGAVAAEDMSITGVICAHMIIRLRGIVRAKVATPAFVHGRIPWHK